MGRINEYFSTKLKQFKQGLRQIRDTPQAVAGGVAIGVMFGFTPLFGFKTLLALLVAWLFRCSKLSAVMAVTLHDILLPLSPFILRWQYDVGFYLISHPHHLPPKFAARRLHFEDFLSGEKIHLAKTWHVFLPTLVGSVVLGVPVAVLMYFLVLEIVKRTPAKARS
jgi:hypothetical protein